MVGTERLHDSTLELGAPEGPTMHHKWLTHFKTQSGKAVLNKSPWELFSDFYERITPDRSKGEMWLTSGRINEIWQSGADDVRKPYMFNRWPDTWVEIHPDDAERVKKAFEVAKPILLEPVHDVQIIIPDEYMGDVMGNINGKRGQIEAMGDRGQAKTVKAKVPLSEMFGYATELRSMTQGRASYTMEFAHYAKVPNNVAEKIKEARGVA